MPRHITPYHAISRHATPRHARHRIVAKRKQPSDDDFAARPSLSECIRELEESIERLEKLEI
jgi:hypothetical protein